MLALNVFDDLSPLILESWFADRFSTVYSGRARHLASQKRSDLYAQIQTATLIDALLPSNQSRRRIAWDVFLIVGFSLFTVLTATMALVGRWGGKPLG